MPSSDPAPRILIVDTYGQPVRWAILARAARYYASGKVLTDLGENLFGMAGGVQEATGHRSEFVTSSIVMIRGRHRIPSGHAHVGLTKYRLFLRDRQICAYCGGQFAESDLTVEHILPVSRGGRLTWTNVVTACRSCNTRKGNRTPEEARMPLLYVPYAVCRNEGFILSNRRILADQMAFFAGELAQAFALGAWVSGRPLVTGKGLRQGALLVLAWAVIGCATIDPYAVAPMAGHLERSDSVGDCARLFRDADARIDAAGVRDGGAPRVAGFPYLRVDRLTAALVPQATQRHAVEPYLESLGELDQRARHAELANLADPALSSASAFDGCRHALAMADQDRLTELAAAAVVPDDYSTLDRALGLYPLTRVFFAAGIADWQRDTRAIFATPLAHLPVQGELIRYAPAPRPPAPPQAARAAVLGLPAYSSAGWAELLARHAPQLAIDTASADDRIGALHWQLRAGDPQIGVDTAAPTAYLRIASTRVNGLALPQLVYTFWFPARTAAGSVDLLAGRLDGLIWRVTLAPDGTPLVYDTIHPCGCYHQFFPTERVGAKPAPSSLDEGMFAPQSVAAPRADQRIELRLAARTHHVQRVSVVAAAGAVASPYEFLDEDRLRSLPLPGGGRRSVYGPDGLVAGSERGERYLFWPMGIASAGQMRQWGRHATAFVGRRHFDDADLIERYFEILPP